MKIIKVIIIILLLILSLVPTVILDYRHNSTIPNFYEIISSIIVGSIYGTKIGELLLRFNSWFNSKLKQYEYKRYKNR